MRYSRDMYQNFYPSLLTKNKDYDSPAAQNLFPPDAFQSSTVLVYVRSLYLSLGMAIDWHYDIMVLWLEPCINQVVDRGGRKG